MAESLATGLAVEATKAVAKVVTARAMKDITLVWGFEKNLDQLRKRLLDIQAFLEDVGTGTTHVKESKRVHRWLIQVKDVAYLADDLMDDYAYEMLRKKIELKSKKSTFKKKCRNFFCGSTNPMLIRFRMSHRVSQIISKFDELDVEAKNIGLQQLARGKLAYSYSHNQDVDLSQTRKYAAARGSEFIGREADEEILVEKLLNPQVKQGDLPIIAIVGIGGLGKTTLARRLYELDVVDEHFDKKKAWICVSTKFDVERILREMVEALTSSRCDLANTGAIVDKLHEEVKKKKFLLVLDDIWNDNAELWDSLKNELHSIGDLAGSVILITTRSIEVAAKARALYSHKLEGLSQTEGWDLLKLNIFTGTGTIPYSSYFEDVGKRIIEKCNGVPLAIKAIRGVLQSKEHLHEWEAIERNELWNLVQPSILPSLLLSYNYLHSLYVKQCFAYCAVFRKDSLIEKDELITLWMAQGFLHEDSETSTSSLTMEMIGEKYFNILVNYSFLQKAKEGYENRYKMHDLVHDVATFISKKDLLVWNEDAELDDASQIRHLVFGWQVFETAPQNIVRKLRTINLGLSMPRWESLINARYLRTLIMCNVYLSEVPSIIGDLVHLRYLDLSYNDEIEVLPESLCKLYQLQTLRLLHCSLLKELPENLYKLVNLRHIYAQEHLLASPRGLRQLTSLQTFPHLVLRDGIGWTIDELEPLNQIKGNLFIRGLEYVKTIGESQNVKLSAKDKLWELNLGWSLEKRENNFVKADEDDVLVLDSFEPHPNLKSLRVSGFMGASFPCWVLKMAVKHCGYTTPLINLTDITLSECRRCQQLPTFGQLPFLIVLRLENFHEVKCIGNEFYESTSNRTTIAEEKVLFATLKNLHIKCFWKVTTWMAPSPALAATAFPSLETLEIHDCPGLEMIPALNFPSLRYLDIVDVGGTQPLDVIKHSSGLTSVQVMLMENITSLPQELSNCSNLLGLEISCDNLKTIPVGLISVKKLCVHGCSSLTYIPDDVFHGMLSLYHLAIWKCNMLKKIPTSLGECISLEFLCINDCPLIEGPVPNLSKLQCLETLISINSGEFTRSSAQWISHLSYLRELQIGGFEDDVQLRQFLLTPALDLRSNQNLEWIQLWNCPKVTFLPQELQILLPKKLQNLLINGFDELEELPDWIGDLSSLQCLSLQNCKKLKLIPSKEVMMRLSQLQKLTIMQCPILEERCAKNYGLDLVKISHIPCRIINGMRYYRDFW